ncbi:MAG TPA: hypothetical protein ENJ84_15290, partial [Gammaproteobacteria bacterium]|nr:hypothetical protein [Gammaproteobacteria bacterium]
MPRISAIYGLFALLWLTVMSLSAVADNAKSARFSSTDKISLTLLEHTQASPGKAQSLPNLSSNNTVQLQAKSAIELDLVLNQINPDTLKKLALKGVTIHHISSEYLRADISIDQPDLLFQLAKIPEIRAIRQNYGAITQAGSVESLAGQALQSDRISGQLDLDGSGQTVGILSDSIAAGPNRDGDTLVNNRILTGSPSQDTNDLPAKITLLADRGFGSDEGAGMAELVHDIAPEANIAFHTAFLGFSSFADGITRLCRPGDGKSTVVVDDVIYFAEAMYQNDIIADAAANCVKSGIPYLSSAGNQGNAAFHSYYVDVDPDHDNQNFLPTGEDFHAWHDQDRYLDIKMGPGASFTAVLQWNQPFDSISRGAGAQIDLDIYVTPTPNPPSIGNLNAFGVNIQGDTGQPAGDALEVIQFSNNSLQSRTV